MYQQNISKGCINRVYQQGVSTPLLKSTRYINRVYQQDISKGTCMRNVLKHISEINSDQKEQPTDKCTQTRLCTRFNSCNGGRRDKSRRRGDKVRSDKREVATVDEEIKLDKVRSMLLE